MGFETDYQSERKKIDTTFDLEVRNAKSVSLDFLKMGYEPQTLRFRGGGTHRDLRVVMRKKGEQDRDGKQGIAADAKRVTPALDPLAVGPARVPSSGVSSTP